jgi:hypothetical protein
MRESVYQRKAMTCEAAAEVIRDLKEKLIMRQLALGYKVMAGHIDGADDQLPKAAISSARPDRAAS